MVEKDIGEEGRKERSEGKNDEGESLIKGVINRKGDPNPETIRSGRSSISNDGSRPYPPSSIPLWTY